VGNSNRILLSTRAGNQNLLPSNENLKSGIKFRNTARLSFKFKTMILMVWRVADRWHYDAGMQQNGAVVV